MDVPKFTLDKLAGASNTAWQNTVTPLRTVMWAASALVEHTLATGHPVALTKVEVIDHHPYITAWCLLESWHIQRSRDTLNREKGTLPEVYTALVK